MAACGLLGLCDDYKKVKERKSDGISSRTKLGWQIVIALIAATFLYLKPEISGFGADHARIAAGEAGYTLGKNNPIGIGAICFPLFKSPLFDLGLLVIPFFAMIIVSCSNAVNLTDGLDGLAIGPTLVSSMTFLALSYVAGATLAGFSLAEYLRIAYIPGAEELGVFCAGMFGAGVAFLWYNTYPASVFMGDVGSLALGGGLGMLAVLTKNEVASAILHGVFLGETVSVILQVWSFKTRGKRIFAMAPIHHHFELKGWAEPKIIVRFWIVSIMLALVALMSIKLR
jgi:phospho-N-acetylmuramoyl-pentapeptide-transferase